MGIEAASACRDSKSARERPGGRVGGQRRWRFGVEGGVRSSVSASDRRRFFDGRGGVCDVGAAVAVRYGILCEDFGFRTDLVGSKSMGLASDGSARGGLFAGGAGASVVVRSDWRVRQVLKTGEAEDWKVRGGGDSMSFEDG